MRFLLAIVIFAALGWSGFWYLSASARETALEGWLEERRADGWVAEVQDITVNGYPNRVDTVASGLELADPDAGWTWTAEEFQLLSLTYEPLHVIAVWPGEQTVSTPYETTTITSSNMRGSVVLKPGLDLEFDRSTIEMDDVLVSGSLGWALGIKHAMLAARGAGDGTDNAYDIAFNAESMMPQGIEDQPGGAFLPKGPLQSVVIDATTTFDRPWDRHAIEDINPEIQSINIKEASATWGRLDLRARGTLDADREGYADGELTVRAKNWREMIDIAEQSGAIPSGMAGLIETGLGFLAAGSGDGERLEVTLDFRDGDARLGPLVIGKAPRLVRR